MGRVRMEGDSLEVELEREADAAQLRVALKLADGADELTGLSDGARLAMDPDNAFNFLALWGTDFDWDRAALARALDCLVPIARGSLHIHTRSQRALMMRHLPARPPGPGGKA